MVFRPLRDLFGSPKPAKKKKLSRRHQQFGHFSGLLEPLEERRLLSVNVAYFDDQWAFVGDADNSQSLSLNDQLNNGNDPGAGAGTVQSTYGNDAFGIITTQPAGLVFTATGSLPGASRVNDAIANTSSGGTVDILHASPLSEGINVNSAVLLSGTFSTTGALALSAPGARISTGSAPGIIWAGSLTLSTNSVLDIKLNGTGFDQIDLLGNAGPTTPSVILSGAVLNVTVESGFTPAVRTSFTIIHDQGLSPVSGTFVGLNEGGVLAVGSQLFQISYKGGTGGDVVLTKVQAPSTTYVDTNWTLAKDFDSGGSLTTGDAVSDGSKQAIFGVNGFGTLSGSSTASSTIISNAIAATASGGVVDVSQSTFLGSVNVNTPVSLQGAFTLSSGDLTMSDSSAVLRMGPTPGTTNISSGNLNLAAGTLAIQVASNRVCDLFNVTSATGVVNLEGAHLSVSFGDYSAAVGDQFTIIQSNNDINGTFASLPEGTTFRAGRNLLFISYSGGASRHNVVLTVASVLPFTTYVNDNWFDVTTNGGALNADDRVNDKSDHGDGMPTVTNTYLGVQSDGGGFHSEAYSDIQAAAAATADGGVVNVLPGTYAGLGDVDVTGNVLLQGAFTLVGSLVVQSANVTLKPNGTPTAATPSPGTITVTSLTLASGSTLAMNLDPLTINGSDLIDVKGGTIDLGGATLSASLASGANTDLTLIRNEGGPAVLGTFAGLPELHSLIVGSQTFSITYKGGESGRDVVLLNPNSTAAIAGRQIFYAGSTRYDVVGGPQGPLPFSDDNAVATDKSALLRSVQAAFVNVTSYDRGINGVMVDITGSHPNITAADFFYQVGNNNAPGSWVPLFTPPTVTVRPAAGANGSDRVELTWPDGTITGKWLAVTVLSTLNTGLVTPDVFFFGNAVGDTGAGDSPTVATVSSVDVTLVQTHGANLNANIPISNLYDFDRDGRVGARDVTLAQTHATNNRTGTQFIFVAAVPTIAAISAPTSLAQGTSAEVLASGVSDPNANDTVHNTKMTGLSFYADTNNNGVWDPGDQFLAAGTAVPGSNNGSWTAAFDPGLLPGDGTLSAGAGTLLAVPVNSSGPMAAAAHRSFYVTSPDVVRPFEAVVGTTWSFSGLPADNYRALITWGVGGSNDVRYRTSADGVSTEFDVDQSFTPIGMDQPWYDLGTIPVTGGSLSLSLVNAGATAPINLNGVQLKRAAGPLSVPSTPILEPGSDSGVLHDGITNDQTPTFVGTAEIGDTIEIFSDGTLIGSQQVADGTYRMTSSSSLVSGLHIITARTTNGLANVTSSPDWLALTIDTSPPSAPSAPVLDIRSDSGASLADNITNVTAPTFTGTADLGDVVQILSDGVVVGSGMASGGAYHVSVSSLSSGMHTIEAETIDVAGNVSSLSDSLSIRILTNPPNAPSVPALDPASDSGAPDGITNVATPIFNGTATDADTVQIYSDGNPVGTGPVVNGNYSIQVNRLSAGAHNITAVAIDVAGNASAPSAGSTITITAAPATPSTPVLDPDSDGGSSQSDHVTNDAIPVFTGRADPGTTVQIFSDGVLAGTGTATPQGTYSVRVPADNSLANGTHTITANALDAQLTTSAFSGGSIVTILLSAAAPSVPALSLGSDSGSSDNDGITNDAMPTFVGSTAPGSKVRLFVDEVAADWTVAASGAYSITLSSSLIDGSHVIAAQATDVAGNISPISAGSTITINTLAPAIPSVPQLDATSDKTFTGTAAPGTSVSILSDGVAVGNGLADESGNYRIFASGIDNGTHTITATATDLLTGNTSLAFAIAIVTIVAPQFRLSDNGTILGENSVQDLGSTFAGKPVAHTYTITNVGGAHLKLYAPVLPSGYSLMTDFGSTDLAPGAFTTFTIQLDANVAGSYLGSIVLGSNDSARSPFSLPIQGQVSAAEIIDDSDPGFTTTGSGWLPAEQADSGAYKGNFQESIQDGSSVGTWTFSGLAAGTYQVQAHWSALADAAASVATFIIRDGGTQVGTATVDQRGDPVGFTDGGVQWQSLGGAVNVGRGVLTISLSAANGVIEADAIRIERVVNHAPVLDKIARQGVDVGNTLTLATTASDPDGQTLQYSLGDGAPDGATISSTGVFSWTPTWQQAGPTYNIQVIASDGQTPPLTATQHFAVTAYSGNQPPVLMPISDQTVSATHLLSFQALANDPDGPHSALTFSLDPLTTLLVPGASITPQGAFSWTPTIAQAGSTYAVTVNVTDGDLPAARTFHITVGQDAAPVTLAKVTNVQLANDTGTPGPNITSARRITGTVENLNGSVVNVPVQFDVNGDNIADGTVFTGAGGQFAIDLTNVLHTDGPVTIKTRAGTVGQNGVTYGSWTSSTFIFQAPNDATPSFALPPSIDTPNYKNGISLTPSVSIPDEGGVATFVGQAVNGAAFANFFARYIGPLQSIVTTTPVNTTTHVAATGNSPDVTDTESSLDQVVSQVNSDGSWTLDETFTSSYLIKSVITSLGLPIYTLVQSGLHNFVFHAMGNAGRASYSLTETGSDRARLQQSTTQTIAGDPRVETIGDATSIDETQAFTLVASGSATIADQQITATDKYGYNSSETNAYANDHSDTKTQTGFLDSQTVHEDGTKGWTYAETRVVNTVPNNTASATDSFSYFNHDRMNFRDLDTISASSSSSTGGVTTNDASTLSTTLAGSSFSTYTLGGSRTDFDNGTWSAVAQDHVHSSVKDQLTTNQDETTDVTDNQSGLVTQSTASNTFTMSRARRLADDFGGTTTTLTDGSKTYSGVTGANTLTDYSWSGSQSNRLTGTDNSLAFTTAHFNSSNSGTDAGNGHATFVASGIVIVNGAGRTELASSTYVETKNGTTTWNNANSGDSTTLDTSVAGTTESIKASNSSTDRGSSSYSSIANETAQLNPDGTSTSNGGVNTTYNGSGDAAFQDSEDVSSVVVSSTGGVSRKTSSAANSTSSGNTHYVPSGGQQTTLTNGLIDVSQTDTLDESGSKKSSGSENVQTNVIDDNRPGFHETSSESMSSSSSRDGTYTSHISDSKTTNADGTWFSSGTSKYNEGGSSRLAESSSSQSDMSDKSVPSVVRSGHDSSSSSTSDDGTYTVTNDGGTSRDLTGKTTSNSKSTDSDSGTTASSSSSDGHSTVTDTSVAGATTTSSADLASSYSGTGTYSQDHSETADTGADGRFTTTSRDDSTFHESGQSTSDSLNTEDSSGTGTDGTTTETFSKSAKSAESRSGTQTTDDSSSSFTVGDGTPTFASNSTTTDKGTVKSSSAINDSSKVTTFGPGTTGSTTQTSQSDEATDGTYSDGSTQIAHLYPDGTSRSSSVTTATTDGTNSFSSRSTTSTKASMTSTVNTDSTSASTTKNSSSDSYLDEQATGPFSTSSTDVSGVAVNGVSTNTHDESQDWKLQGQIQSGQTDTRKVHEQDDSFDPFVFIPNYTRTLDGTDTQSRSNDGTFTAISHSDLHRIGTLTVSSDSSNTRREGGSFASSDSSTTKTHALDQTKAYISTTSDSQSDQADQVTNGSYSTSSSDSSTLLRDGSVSSSSSSRTSEDGATSSNLNSWDKETTTDTSVPGVLSKAETKHSEIADGTGAMSSLATSSTVDGSTEASNKESDSQNGTLHRKTDIHNTSNGVPSSSGLPGASYTTQTASSSFDQHDHDDGTFDDKSSTSNASANGVTISSSNKSFHHENLQAGSTQTTKSDGDAQGITATGTFFHNTSHSDSTVGESWDEDTTNDQGQSSGIGGNTSYNSSTDTITNGQETNQANSNTTSTETTYKGTLKFTRVSTNSSNDDLQTTFDSTTTDSKTTDHFNGLPGSSGFSHKDSSEVTSTVSDSSASTSSTILDNTTNKASMTTKSTVDTSGVGADQTTTTTSTAAGSGQKVVTHTESSSYTTAADGFDTVTDTKATTNKTTTDFTTDGSESETDTGGQRTSLSGKATVLEHVAVKNSTDGIETVDFVSQSATNNDSSTTTTTIGSSDQDDSDVKLERSIDPATFQVVTKSTTTNETKSDDHYYIQEYHVIDDDTIGTLHTTLHSDGIGEVHHGNKGPVAYTLLSTSDTTDSTVTDSSNGGKYLDYETRDLRKEFDDDSATNTQTFTSHTDSKVSASGKSNEPNSAYSNVDTSSHDKTLVQTHPDGYQQHVSHEKSSHSTHDTSDSSGPFATKVDSEGGEQIDYDVQSSQSGLAVNSFTDTLDDDTTTAHADGSSEHVVQHSTGQPGDGMGLVTTTTTETDTYPDGSSITFGGPQTWAYPIDATTLSQLTAFPPGSVGPQTYKYPDIWNASFAQPQDLAAATGSVIESIFSKIGISPATAFDLAFPIPGLGAIARFAGDTAWNAANAVVDAAVTDFSNLRASGFGIIGASTVTTGDLLGRAIGVEGIENAREGKDRAGDHLSGLERTVDGAIGAIGVVTTAVGLAPAVKAGAAAIFSTGVNAAGEIGLTGVSAVEREVVETASSTLSAGQASSLSKFIKKLPSAAEETIVHNLPGGGKAFAANVPGNVPGSFAQYLKQVGPDGKTILFYKTTFNPSGAIVHVKDKLDNFTWLWETL